MTDNLILPIERGDRLRASLATFVAEVLRTDTGDMLRLLQREGLSMPRIATLNFVELREAASISEISTYLQLSLANTSTLVDKLVCGGFVTRAEDAKDRRHKVVQLTDKGRALVQDLRATRVEHLVQRMLRLPPALVDQTIATLDDVTSALAHMSVEQPAELS